MQRRADRLARDLHAQRERQSGAVQRAGEGIDLAVHQTLAHGGTVWAHSESSTLTIRKLDDRHHFTLMCKDFAQLGQLVKVDNAAFRAIPLVIVSTEGLLRRWLMPRFPARS